jgi:hypothetical protein
MSAEAVFVSDGDSIRFLGLLCDGRDELEYNSQVRKNEVLESGIEKSMEAAKTAFKTAGYTIHEEAALGFTALLEIPDDQGLNRSIEFFSLLETSFPGLGERMLEQTVDIIKAG